MRFLVLAVLAMIGLCLFADSPASAQCGTTRERTVIRSGTGYVASAVAVPFRVVGSLLTRPFHHRTRTVVRGAACAPSPAVPLTVPAPMPPVKVAPPPAPKVEAKASITLPPITPQVYVTNGLFARTSVFGGSGGCTAGSCGTTTVRTRFFARFR